MHSVKVYVKLLETIKGKEAYKIGITSQSPPNRRLNGYGNEFREMEMITKHRSKEIMKGLEKELIGLCSHDLRCKNISGGGTGNLDGGEMYWLYVAFN